MTETSKAWETRMAKKEKGEEQDTFASIIEAIDSVEVEPDRHVSIQIDRSLRDAIRAAQGSGQKAAVDIKLTVKSGPERRMIFACTVNAKLPRPPVSAVTLYADNDGNVHKSDPAQTRLPFPAPIPFSSKES